MTTEPSNQTYGEPSYGITRRFSGRSFADAVGATKAALGTEGFGVLTEIDVKATLHKKLGVDFRNYLILGACNPPLAHQALSAELPVGLLLPCNVVVTEEPDGSIVVSAIDPEAQFKVLGRPDVERIAREVQAKLTRAFDALLAQPR